MLFYFFGGNVVFCLELGYWRSLGREGGKLFVDVSMALMSVIADVNCSVAALSESACVQVFTSVLSSFSWCCICCRSMTSSLLADIFSPMKLEK